MFANGRAASSTTYAGAQLELKREGGRDLDPMTPHS